MAGSRDLVFLHRIAGFGSVVGELGIGDWFGLNNSVAVFAVGLNVMRALGLAGSRNNVHVSCELRTLVLVCNLGENLCGLGEKDIALCAAGDLVNRTVGAGRLDSVFFKDFTCGVGHFVKGDLEFVDSHRIRTIAHREQSDEICFVPGFHIKHVGCGSRCLSGSAHCIFFEFTVAEDKGAMPGAEIPDHQLICKGPRTRNQNHQERLIAAKHAQMILRPPDQSLELNAPV